MAPTTHPSEESTLHKLRPRYFDVAEGYLFWIKCVLISVFGFIALIVIIRLFYWYRNYTRNYQQNEAAWWQRWHWNQRQQQEQQWISQQEAQRQARLARERDRRRQPRTPRPSMRTTPVPPQPAVIRMHFAPSPPPPPQPQPVNLMFVMVNVPDTDPQADTVPRGDTRSPTGSTRHSQQRREGITRASGGDERGHRRTPSRNQSRNQHRSSVSRSERSEPPPAYQP